MELLNNYNNNNNDYSNNSSSFITFYVPSTELNALQSKAHML